MKRFWIAAALAAVMLWTGAQAVNARQEHPPRTTLYTVRPGDTLWKIAREARISSDTRDAVAVLVDLNELGRAPLQPGQRIKIPA